jgi:hypothetical protein
MLQDFRSALRWIARRPGLAFVSVASLGLGIGANLAVFSVIDAFLFRPFLIFGARTSLRRHVAHCQGASLRLGAGLFRFRRIQSDRFRLAARMPFTFSVHVGDVTERA